MIVIRSLIVASTLLTLPVSAKDVQQSGTVTPGHVTTWTTDGVVQDGGTPQDPKISGGIGVYSTNQQSICTQNAKSGPRTQLCMGVTPTEADLTVQNYSGGPELPFYIIINGGKFPFPGPAIPGGQFLFATNYGVKADGTTPDDAALAAAVDACAAIGATLWLPTGRILLTGGATINLRNCSMVGSGSISGGGPSQATAGTTLALTSTSVRPFNCGFYWSWSGFSVYYPNQNGLTAYPPLLSDDGSGGCGHATISNVTWINPYDGISQVGLENWGDIIITNSRLFAVRDVLRLSALGDGFTVTSVRADPGPWLSLCNYTCQAQIDNATGSNSFLHATAGGTVNISLQASVLSGFRYGIRLDSGATIGESDFNAVFEVGSVIDASAGGNYAFQNVMTGQSTCAIPKYAVSSVKGSPCFTMGANSGLFLNDFLGNASGDFLNMSGGFLKVRNTEVDNFRDTGSTTDYYVAHITGVVDAVFQNNNFNGSPAHVHAHGIVVTTSGTTLKIQGNSFQDVEEAINAATASGANIITGNASGGTTGSPSIILTGNNQVIYSANQWDKPPVSTVSSCGSSPPAVQGAFAGLFTTGSGSPTSCTLTFPWVPYGFGVGACSFTPVSTVTVSGTPATIKSWTVGFSAGYNSADVYYNCPGQQ